MEGSGLRRNRNLELQFLFSSLSCIISSRCLTQRRSPAKNKYWLVCIRVRDRTWSPASSVDWRSPLCDRLLCGSWSSSECLHPALPHDLSHSVLHLDLAILDLCPTADCQDHPVLDPALLLPSPLTAASLDLSTERWVAHSSRFLCLGELNLNYGFLLVAALDWS